MRNGYSYRLPIRKTTKAGAQCRENENPEVGMGQPRIAACEGCGGEG